MENALANLPEPKSPPPNPPPTPAPASTPPGTSGADGRKPKSDEEPPDLEDDKRIERFPER
jgi:hypothetical protein